jgi:hypothetical protein
MANLYFSPTAMGFFLEAMEKPEDSVEVSAAAETFLRRAIIWGATGFIISNGEVSVTYPGFLREYVTDNDAPVNFQDGKAS